MSDTRLTRRMNKAAMHSVKCTTLALSTGYNAVHAMIKAQDAMRVANIAINVANIATLEAALLKLSASHRYDEAKNDAIITKDRAVLAKDRAIKLCDTARAIEADRVVALNMALTAYDNYVLIVERAKPIAALILG